METERSGGVGLLVFVAVVLLLVNLDAFTRRPSPYGLEGATSSPAATESPKTIAAPADAATPGDDWLSRAEAELDITAGDLGTTLTASQQLELAAEVKRKAEAGDGASMYRLSNLYFAGVGVQRDYDASTEWTRRSAEAGYPHAQYRFAVHLIKRAMQTRNAGGKVYPPGQHPAETAVITPEARQWLHRAIAAGDEWGIALLENEEAPNGEVCSNVAPAKAALRGEGVPQDVARAIRLLTEDKTCLEAAELLADLYTQGSFVSQDFGKAAAAFKAVIRAAGHAKVGKLYEAGGPGLPRDLREALAAYRRAVAAGYAASAADVERLEKALDAR